MSMNEKTLLAAREIISGYLSSRRRELGMSQQDLADATGLGIQTIKRMEDAKFWPGLKQFLIVCHALQLYFFVEEKEGKGDGHVLDKDRQGVSKGKRCCRRGCKELGRTYNHKD